MISILAALLVRDDFIDWDSTLLEVYPELLGVMRAEYEYVRLDELLAHTSGIPLNFPGICSYFTDNRNLAVQRQEVVEKILVLPSTATRGVFQYSNFGYIIAGAMLEKVTGCDWETLLHTSLIDPLLMAQAGFGASEAMGLLAQQASHACGETESGNQLTPLLPTMLMTRPC